MEKELVLKAWSKGHDTEQCVRQSYDLLNISYYQKYSTTEF